MSLCKTCRDTPQSVPGHWAEPGCFVLSEFGIYICQPSALTSHNTVDTATPGLNCTASQTDLFSTEQRVTPQKFVQNFSIRTLLQDLDLEGMITLKRALILECEI
jgi:hypothetical protein